MSSTKIEDCFIGQKLRTRRSILGISQERLGKFEGISFQQIQKYETGKNRISSGRLYRLSKILHVPVTYFFEGLDDVVGEYCIKDGRLSIGAKNEIDLKKIGMREFHLDTELKKLNKNFLKIKDGKLRKSVVDLAKRLAESEKGGGERKI